MAPKTKILENGKVSKYGFEISQRAAKLRTRHRAKHVSNLSCKVTEHQIRGFDEGNLANNDNGIINLAFAVTA